MDYFRILQEIFWEQFQPFEQFYLILQQLYSMNISMQQLKRLEDSTEFYPMHIVKSNKRQTPIKIRNAQISFFSVQKQRNKIFIRQKKQLQKFQQRQSYSDRYNPSNLLVLAAKTKQVLRPKSEGKIKKLTTNNMSQSNSLIDKKKVSRVQSPISMYSQLFRQQVYIENNPQFNCEPINKNNIDSNMRIHEKIDTEQYFKTIIKNSNKFIKRSSLTDTKCEIELQNSQWQQKQKKPENRAKKLYFIQKLHPPPAHPIYQLSRQRQRQPYLSRKQQHERRPVTTNFSQIRRNKSQKQRKSSFQNLQPW